MPTDDFLNFVIATRPVRAPVALVVTASIANGAVHAFIASDVRLVNAPYV